MAARSGAPLWTAYSSGDNREAEGLSIQCVQTPEGSAGKRNHRDLQTRQERLLPGRTRVQRAPQPEDKPARLGLLHLPLQRAPEVEISPLLFVRVLVLVIVLELLPRGQLSSTRTSTSTSTM